MNNDMLKSHIYTRLIEYLFEHKKMDVDYCIARSMIQNIYKFPNITIKEIAYEANTTPASVTKFCRKLKYKSFKELRMDTKLYNNTKLFCNLENNTDTKGIHEAFLTYTMHTQTLLLDIFNTFDLQQISRIAKQISQSRSVAIISGIHSFNASNLFFELLIPYNIPVFEISRDSDNDIINATLEEDIIFIISLTQEWLNEHVDILKTSSLNAKNIILITYHPFVNDLPYQFENIILEKVDTLFHSRLISSYTLETLFILLSTYVGIEKS